MQYEKDYFKFHGLLESVRKTLRVTSEQLCGGLCSVTQMHYIERGDRLPDYLMRNRIMARLGISAEGYEDYVQYDEYDRWCQRQEIIKYVEDSDWEKAKTLLEEIRQNYKKDNKIEKQFLLDMEAKLLIHEGASDEEIYGVYLDIKKLTMDKYGYNDAYTLLSPTEYYYLINYLLYEYRYSNNSKTVEKLRTIIERIIDSPLAGIAKAKVLPFAVVTYYSLIENTYYSMTEMWNYTCQAIESLQDTERSYYLKELVDIRQRLITKGQINFDNKLEKDVADFLSKLEERYKVIIPPWQNCYIYRDSRVCCISKVIHDRRRMLGMSRMKLAEGICSLRTLERIEANHSKPQQYVMQSLFERLNLEGEYRRGAIITQDITLINKYNELRNAINQKKSSEIVYLAEYIISRLDERYISNKQEIIRLKCFKARFEGEISLEQYLLDLEKALSLSVNEYIKRAKYYFLTSGEMLLLYNIAARKEFSGWEKEILCEQSMQADDLSFYSFYELVKDGESSKLGNAGEYDLSNDISDDIIRFSLRLCRLHGIYRAVSNISWNEYEKHKTEKSVELHNKLLKNCINVCDFCHSKMAEVYIKSLK